MKNSTVGGILCFYSSYKALKPLITISHNDVSNNDGIGIQLLCSSDLNINIDSNTLLNNISNNTGGVYINTNNANIQMDAKINNNTFISNIGDDGGAIKMNFFMGSFDIQSLNNSFLNNTAKSTGGAVSIESANESYGSILFDNNIICSNNSINSNGGAFYINTQGACRIIIRSCIISNNNSGKLYGGAIACNKGSFYSVNNLINNNSLGGVFISSNGGGTLINNTIAYNENAGVIIDKDEKEVSLYNNLIVNNSKESNLGSTNINRGKNITGNLDCFKNPPSFVGHTDMGYDYQAFDFNLISNSIAINYGLLDTLNMLLPSTDLAGKPRIIGDTIDIGAFESEINTYSTSIEDISNVSVFPNPCIRNLHLKNINPSTNIAIYNSVGTKVGSFICNTNYITLDLSYLKRGVYFLKINDCNTSYQTKILKL